MKAISYQLSAISLKVSCFKSPTLMNQPVNFRSPLDDPESLPLLKIETIVNPSDDVSILIVAPHPDDETLGCGGAIALCHQLNIPVEVLIISDGTKSHPNSLIYPASTLKLLREQESLDALAILGLDSAAVSFLSLPDSAVPTQNQPNYSSAIALCEHYLRPIAPSIIFLPWRNDPHADHRASWGLIQVACEHLSLSPRLIEYPIWDWDEQQRQNFTESVDVWRLDISSVLDLKKCAIAKYRSQTTDLINDDPDAFRLTPEILQNFIKPWEVYLEQTNEQA
jgi:LmbE family N-acetylglucosaminyl deacetylase